MEELRRSLHVSGSALIGFLITVVATPESTATPVHSPASHCGLPIRVVSERDARVGEKGFEESVPLLKDPENSWVIPGVGSMRAVVKHDQNRKPALYVEDTLSHSLKRVDSLLASGPVRWSPNGRLLGVVSWRSRERAWVPCIVEVATGRTISPSRNLMGTGFKWSPDGRWIAVDGRAPDGSKSYLWVMSSANGACRILDTLGVYSNYEFGWSPDSRLLVASRPMTLTEDEDKVRADLWAFETSGHKALLLAAKGFAARNPRWIDARHVIYRREVPDMSTAPRERILTVTCTPGRVGREKK